MNVVDLVGNAGREVVDERVDTFAKPDATKVGRKILTAAGVVVAIGIVGGAMGYAVDQWSWLPGLFSAAFEWFGAPPYDCSKLVLDDEALKRCRPAPLS